jgi:putative restriction endonuclease
MRQPFPRRPPTQRLPAPTPARRNAPGATDAMALSAATRTLLEKTALDTGFDRELPREGDWLCYASSHTSMRLGLTALGDRLFFAAVSHRNVLAALAEAGPLFTNPLPTGAVGARGGASLEALLQLVRRAFMLSRTLPDELFRRFTAETAALPRATEAERLVVQRVGQNVFGAGRLDYWEGRCAITGLAVPELLRASHIKPWAICETDAERLDVFNGLLLAPNLDAAFDAGFITVQDDGKVLVSPTISHVSREILSLATPLRVASLREEHHAYLGWHRAQLFRDGPKPPAAGSSE